jgi:hypothetical protein
MMMKLILPLLLGTLVPTISHGESIQCNKKQTACVTENKDWTIGDKVGVFNSEGELIAVGKVKKMRQARRHIGITKRHGKIKSIHNFALLSNSASDVRYRDDYSIYREPAKISAGASAGLTSLAIGNGTPGVEMSIFGQMRKFQGLQLVGRGTYIGASGEVSRTRKEIETEKLSVDGFGALGGVAYNLRENKKLGFRGELGLGFMYMAADVGGDSALVEDTGYSTHLNDGFGKYLRGSGSVLLNMKDWHVNMEFAYSAIHDARSTAFIGGIIKDIK